MTSDQMTASAVIATVPPPAPHLLPQQEQHRHKQYGPYPSLLMTATNNALLFSICLIIRQYVRSLSDAAVAVEEVFWSVIGMKPQPPSFGAKGGLTPSTDPNAGGCVVDDEWFY